MAQINKLSNGSYQLTARNSDALKCEKHKFELTIYCESCEKLVCLYCTVKDHSGHTHDVVDELADKHREVLKTRAIDPLKEMMKNLSKATDGIDDMVEKIRQQAEVVDKKIDQFYDDLMGKIKTEKQEQKKNLSMAVSQKEKALKEQREQVKNVTGEVESMNELTDGLEKKFDEEQDWYLSAEKPVIDHVKQITDRYNELDTKPVALDLIEFHPSFQPFPQFGQLYTLGDSQHAVARLPQHVLNGDRIEVGILVKDSNGSRCTKGGSVVAVEVVYNHYSGGEVSSEVVKDNGDGSYTASFMAKVVGETKVSVSIAGQPIEGSPYIVVVDRKYPAVNKPSKVVTANGQISQPWGISFGRDGVWAVADETKHCVYIFDGQDQLVRSFGSRGNSNAQFIEPQGVAFDSANHLYVADYGNHRVQQFDISGQYLLQLGTGREGSGDGQLNGPYGVSAHNGKVYVADRNNNRVSVFTTDGQFCCTIGSGQCSSPRDVVVNKSNQLLVASGDSHCIYTYTLDGQCVGQFGGKGSDRGQLNAPHSLTTDLNGFVLVADTNNHRVSVFGKDGTCIHCFGSSGIGEGQFNHPRGIALSPNGSIYVSDYDNHRIQIFSNY